MADKPRIPIEETLRRAREWAERNGTINAAPEDQEVVDRLRADQKETIHKLNELQNGKTATVVKMATARGNGKLELRPATLPDLPLIPPREWLYGTKLIRGCVSVLVAPGGTGKTVYAMTVAIELASGQAVLGDKLFHRVNACIINLDDPMDELDRRAGAIMLAHNIPREKVSNRLFLEDCDGHRLVMAASERDDTGSVIVTHPDEQILVAEIRKHNIGLVVCDPFAESHELEENSNPHMIRAAAVWRRIARATNCAVLLVHHVRKGEISGIDAARGAKAVTDSARVGLLMSTMSAAEAEQWQIDAEEERFSYVRIDDAKRNMAAASKAKWFQLKQVNLGNGTADYPAGDNVAAITAWEPPQDELKAAANPDLNRALDTIEAGPGGGCRYSDSRKGRGGGANWVGNVLCQMFSTTDAEATKMINRWLQSGLLYVEEYKHPIQRRMTPGIFVNDTKRPS